MQTGKIRGTHQRRSYGYILPEEETKKVYFHFEDFSGEDIEVEAKVKYRLESTDWGERAFDVELV
jgi:cold shock CspA family protein